MWQYIIWLLRGLLKYITLCALYLLGVTGVAILVEMLWRNR
jgi:hypothetical protein